MSATTPLAASSMTPMTPGGDREFRKMAALAARQEIRRATYGFGFHSTALQIKDQQKSKEFYTTVLGMDVVKETESHDVTMIWLAFPDPTPCEDEALEFGQRRGMLQLIHIAGSETDDSFRISHGAAGFCHVCLSVPDLEKAMARIKSMKVEVIEEGSNDQGYGAIADPDGYSIQLLHCQIDQSLALKRQLEELMSLSSASSARRNSDFSEKASSMEALSKQCSNADSLQSSLFPDLGAFRGGSPNLEHPAWQNTYFNAPMVDSAEASASSPGLMPQSAKTVTATLQATSPAESSVSPLSAGTASVGSPGNTSISTSSNRKSTVLASAAAVPLAAGSSTHIANGKLSPSGRRPSSPATSPAMRRSSSPSSGIKRACAPPAIVIPDRPSESELVSFSRSVKVPAVSQSKKPLAAGVNGSSHSGNGCVQNSRGERRKSAPSGDPVQNAPAAAARGDSLASLTGAKGSSPVNGLGQHPHTKRPGFKGLKDRFSFTGAYHKQSH